MESKKIKEILKQFDGNNTYKKIFINGSWGIGKSYYTNEYIEEHKDNIIYISLFGKTSFESINDSLSKELAKKLNNVDKFKKKAERFAQNIQGSISICGLVSLNSPSINNKTLLEEFSKLLSKKELLIIIDDLERKSINIPIEDIMGLIEEFSTLEKVKIAIIGDESNIDKEDKLKWEKFKEKIIEKEYKIDCFSYDAIESIVINRLSIYISKDNLEEFISSFLSKHKTKNLRTINKGINLFIEIVENYVKEKYDEMVYLTILKNCMAVAIEYTEELYKPKEDNDSKDTTKSWAYSLDFEIPSRIISHYFGSIFMNHKDASILDYVIKFYNSETTDEIIENFNNVLKNYINIKEERNIFYLSEKEIISKVEKIYKDIQSEKYVITTLEEFVDDIYNLLNYNNVFSLGYKLDTISNYVNNVLFTQYYDVAKEEYQNQVDTFSYIKHESKELYEVLNKYNEEVSKKYAIDKIDFIVNRYKSSDLNTDYLSFLKWKFVQQDSQNAKEYFFKCCKNNNFLLPNLDEELLENEWAWTHQIWYLYHDFLDTDCKTQLNDYAETLKFKNNLAKYRINALQEYRPLVQKK